VLPPAHTDAAHGPTRSILFPWYSTYDMWAPLVTLFNQMRQTPSRARLRTHRSTLALSRATNMWAMVVRSVFPTGILLVRYRRAPRNKLAAERRQTPREPRPPHARTLSPCAIKSEHGVPRAHPNRTRNLDDLAAVNSCDGAGMTRSRRIGTPIRRQPNPLKLVGGLR
jgi:hypothetical protein